MLRDIPSVAKHCARAPLRYSLIVWAYTKLLTSAFVSGLVTIWLFEYVAFVYRQHGDVLLAVFATVLILFFDAVFNVAVIIGHNKKNVTLLRLCYRYGIMCMVAFTILLLVWITIATTISGRTLQDPDSIIYVIILTCFLTGLLITQIYLSFAIRNEMFKLKAIERFRFIYPAPTSSR